MLKGFIRHILNILRGGKQKCFVQHNVNIVNSNVGRYTSFAHHSDVLNSTIGNRTSIGRYAIIRNSDIGSYCAISWNVTIGADHHPTERISGSAAFFNTMYGLASTNISKGNVKRTHIGNDVLISTDVTVISGVSIGDGSIVGAGAVVTKDIPPYSIAVGNPARVIKKRFDEESINKLMELQWWDFPDHILKENIELFQKPLTNQIIDEIKTLKQKNEKDTSLSYRRNGSKFLR